MTNENIDEDKNSTSDNIGSNTVGVAIDQIEAILKGLSKSDAQKALKAVGAIRNIRFVPAFAPLAPPGQSQPSRDTRGQTKPRVQPKADPMAKNLRLKIKELNSMISSKSKKLGRALDENDELIILRAKFFRDLKGTKNPLAETFKEVAQQEEKGAQSGHPALPELGLD